MKRITAALILLWLITAHAEIIENDPRITVRTIEPDRDVGYTVGDILHRTVILEAPSAFELLPTSLPIAGNDKKRRGRGSGIELRDIRMEKTPGIGKNTYTIHLSYQIFTSHVVARPAALPAEIVKFARKGESFDFRIPSWSFRISPLAVFGAVVVEKDMSGFRGPLLMEATRHRQILVGALAVLALAALGLLYVLGSRAWLPRMGRPFARAYRDLGKLPSDAAGLAQAVKRLHHALNATAGSSVFDADGFLKAKPAFAPLAADIATFFKLSRSVFFEPGASHGIAGDPMVWLRRFCRRCRDCERGLK